MSREIDIRIIREVMKLDQSDWREDAYPCIERRYQTDEGETVWHVFSPSEDASDAMEVVERMGVLGYNTHIEWKGAGREFEHTAEVSMHKVGGGTRGGHATADTFTLAVCLAALRAVGGEGGRT